MNKKAVWNEQLNSAIIALIVLVVVVGIILVFIQYTEEIKDIAQDVFGVEEEVIEFEFREKDAFISFNAVVNDLKSVAGKEDCVSSLKNVPYIDNDYYLEFNNRQSLAEKAVSVQLNGPSNKVLAYEEIPDISMCIAKFGLFDKNIYENEDIFKVMYSRRVLILDRLRDLELKDNVPLFYTDDKDSVCFLIGSVNLDFLKKCEINDYELIDTRKSGKKIIVIDPAFGGEEKGRVFEDMEEKNLTLDIAFKIREMLESVPDYEVVLTREEDETKSRTDRYKLANEKEADLLIGVSANAIKETETCTKVEGGEVSVYCNCPDVCEFSDECLKDKGDRLLRSMKFASLIEKQFTQTDRPWRGLRGEDRAILEKSDMPAVLFKVGYLCNDDEAELLKENEWRTKYARVVFGSVINYFNEEPLIVEK